MNINSSRITHHRTTHLLIVLIRLLNSYNMNSKTSICNLTTWLSHFSLVDLQVKYLNHLHNPPALVKLNTVVKLALHFLRAHLCRERWRDSPCLLGNRSPIEKPQKETSILKSQITSFKFKVRCNLPRKCIWTTPQCNNTQIILCLRPSSSIIPRCSNLIHRCLTLTLTQWWVLNSIFNSSNTSSSNSITNSSNTCNSNNNSNSMRAQEWLTAVILH